ncbi:MAG TPA: hypothetical protein VEJ84_15100 [Acidimicrobiales bacterium]|nr:hypothetical protein [Acidimicrobiales bacterium]
MNTKKIAARVASTAAVVLVPLALSTVASASPRYTPHARAELSPASRGSAPNAWATRTSSLPSGGAALFDGLPLYGGSAFYNVPAAPAQAGPVVPNAWATRTGSLPSGGAALFL